MSALSRTLLAASVIGSLVHSPTTLCSVVAPSQSGPDRVVAPARRMTRAIKRLAMGSPTQNLEVMAALNGVEHLNPEL